MPIEKAGSAHVGAVRKLVENAAAAGINAAQLKQLLNGVELKLTGLFGIKADDAPVKALFSDAADQLARILDDKQPPPPSADPKGAPVVADDPLTALTKKVDDAKAKNQVARGDLETKTKDLASRLPDFLVGKQVSTAAGAVRELLNPVTPGQPKKTQTAVALLQIDLERADNKPAIYGSLLLTGQGIRLYTDEYKFTGKPSVTAPSIEQLHDVLTRAGITFERLALAVDDAIAGLAGQKNLDKREITPRDLDRLIPDPFRPPFDIEKGKTSIEAIRHMTPGEWAPVSAEANERGKVALDLIAQWTPDKVSGADLLTLGRTLIGRLHQTQLRAGNDAVASLSAADAVATLKSLLEQCDRHGLTASDQYPIRQPMRNFLELLTSKSARAPDGTYLSASSAAPALAALRSTI